MSFPCAVTRDLDAYQGRVDAEDAYMTAIEREIDGFMGLTVRELWAMMPDSGRDSLSDRFSEILNDLAAGELAYHCRWQGEPN